MAPADTSSSRFLLSSSDFSATKQRVKAKAYLPSPQDGCTSVFIVDGLNEGEIWRLGRQHLGERADRLKARADLGVTAIEKVGLKVRRDDAPVRHALIDGWPPEKEKQLDLALQLAEEATLWILPQAAVAAVGVEVAPVVPAEN